MQWVEFHSTSGETLSEISYRFRMSPAIALLAMGFAASMGDAGGLLPALKAARTPVAQVIRGN